MRTERVIFCDEHGKVLRDSTVEFEGDTAPEVIFDDNGEAFAFHMGAGGFLLYRKKEVVKT